MKSLGSFAVAVLFFACSPSEAGFLSHTVLFEITEADQRNTLVVPQFDLLHGSLVSVGIITKTSLGEFTATVENNGGEPFSALVQSRLATKTSTPATAENPRFSGSNLRPFGSLSLDPGESITVSSVTAGGGGGGEVSDLLFVGDFVGSGDLEIQVITRWDIEASSIGVKPIPLEQFVDWRLDHLHIPGEVEVTYEFLEGGPPIILDPAVIPEPSTIALFGLGLAGAGVTAWRRRRRAHVNGH